MASVLVGSLGLTALAAAWWTHLPRLEKQGDGPVRPLGIAVGKELPAGFGRWSSLSTPGYAPVRLLFGMSGLGRTMTARDYDWREMDSPPAGRVAARLVLPNGVTAPLDVQRNEDRLLVDIRGDIPPVLNRLTVELFVPGKPVSRFRVVNPGTGAVAFDQSRRVLDGGGVVGEAWWQPQEKGSLAPALFSRLSVPDFRDRAGEVGELHYRTEGPFAERGHEPWVRLGESSRLDARHPGIAEWVNTPYAGYAKAMHSTGTVRRYRFLDETIDLGTAPLRPRRRRYGSPKDAAPDLSAPRTATTPGGLRLTVPVRNLEDNMDFATGMTVSVPFDVDRTSVTRGLPPDMARLAQTHPVEISIKPISRTEDWFTAVDYEPRLREPNVIYPRYTTFSDVAKGPISSFPLRFRVRRQVLVESTPFDLTVPVVGPRHLVKYPRGPFANGEGVVDLHDGDPKSPFFSKR